MPNDPPNIAGIWIFTDRDVLIQLIPNGPVDLNNLRKIPDIEVSIQQKGLFVTFTPLSPGLDRSVLDNRLGVWQPLLSNCNQEVISWKLLLSDYAYASIAFIQVLDTAKCSTAASGEGDFVSFTKCDKPIKLIYSSIESGFSATNPLQVPFASRGILIKKKKVC